MAMRATMSGTVRSYKAVAGKDVQRVESYEERGELGVVTRNIEIQFTDRTILRFFVGARTELDVEIEPARKKAQRVTGNGKSRAATA
jgi:hypothetical protein